MSLKDLVRPLIPQGICDYSVRRNEYLRLGFSAQESNSAAFSLDRYRALCESRLNLVPKAIISSLRTCIDAGAHEGSWTGALVRNFAPERVIAVECEPRLVKPLTARFGGNSAIRVVKAALAGTEGIAKFHQLRHPAGSSLLKPRPETAREFAAQSWDVLGTVDVQKISYDRLVADEEEISILKLDIQGAEMDVLSNSHDGLAKTKAILMEVTFTSHYENDAGFPELHSLMGKKGFGLYRLSPPYHRGGRILYADALYIREEVLRKLAGN
jgi:FkbM family methyltransferase